LQRGEGVAQDKAEAAIWFRRASEAGDASAMVNLAIMLAAGSGVAKDKALAVTWYRRALVATTDPVVQAAAEDGILTLGEEP
jgi:TPR repeat protein